MMQDLEALHHFFAFCLAGATVTTMAGCSDIEASEARTPDMRPDIVFILSDDHRFDAFGHMDDRLETPELDRLLTEGLHFENAFVTTSLCSPSRASIQYSQPMRLHGVVDNNSPTPKGLDPFAVYLDQAGYDTAFIGKWHMGNDDASPKSGFDHWVSFEGQGNYGPVDAFGRESLLNVNGRSEPQDGYITDVLTDRAVDWIDSRDAGAPLFLTLSHKAAHLPFTAAGRHAGRYDDTDFPLPASADPDARSGPHPMWLSAQRNSWHGVDFPFHSDLPIEAYQRRYHASLLAVDESLGRIRDALDRRGRDTAILYTSDNGFLFGEQGLIDKRTAYEASMRVPMILHAPGHIASGTKDAIVRNIDVAPTLLALAGVPAPPHFEGRDMLAPRTEGPEQLIYEYFWEFNYPQTPTTFALRDARYKYIQYHGVWDVEELFDLETDPQETNNLVRDPDHRARLVQMRASLHEALSGDESNPAIPFTARFNQGAVFWSDDGTDHVDFPQRWKRSADAPDLYEHIIPDGPDKAARLDAITPAVRAALTAAADEEPSP
ncbi:MAG: sulfatase [Litorimonas sp.]